MLRRKKKLPLDYSLCRMTVTVYAPDGRRRVLSGVHYEFTHTLTVSGGMDEHSRGFLLVIPGADPIAVGDKVVLGIGPENMEWKALNTVQVPTLGVALTVKPRYFQGQLCHTEVRG